MKSAQILLLIATCLMLCLSLSCTDESDKICAKLYTRDSTCKYTSSSKQNYVEECKSKHDCWMSNSSTDCLASRYSLEECTAVLSCAEYVAYRNCTSLSKCPCSAEIINLNATCTTKGNGDIGKCSKKPNTDSGTDSGVALDYK